MRILKINQMNAMIRENDEPLFVHIPVYRFFKRILSLDRLLKHALPLDRFFI